MILFMGDSLAHRPAAATAEGTSAIPKREEEGENACRGESVQN